MLLNAALPLESFPALFEQHKHSGMTVDPRPAAVHRDEADWESRAVCCSVNTAPEKHWNVSAVGAGGQGQPEAKAGGIHQNRG